jgi:Family of unknown function (DUF6049)
MSVPSKFRARRTARSTVAAGLLAIVLPFGHAAHGAVSASVSVTQQGFTIVGDASWRVVVDLGGASEENLNLDFVSYRRVDTRQQLADVIAGKLPQELDRVRYPVDKLTRNDAGRVIVSVPTVSNSSQPENLLFGTSGVYPVAVRLLAGENPLGQTVTLVHHVDSEDALGAMSDGPLRVMPVVTLGAAPARTSNGKNAPSPQFRNDVSAFIDTYDNQTGGAFVSLQGDQTEVAEPGLIASLKAQSSRHSFAATPFVPLSPSALTTIGKGELYSSQLRSGEDAVATAIGTSPDRAVIVSNDKLTADGARVLRDMGARGVILTPNAVDVSGLRGRLDSALTYRSRAADGSILLIHSIDDTYAKTFADESTPPLSRAVRIAAGLILQRSSLLGMGKDLALVSVALGTRDARPANTAVMKQLFRFIASSSFLSLEAAPLPTDVETSGDLVQLSPAADSSLEPLRPVLDTLSPIVTSTSSMLIDTDPRRNEWPALLTTMLSSRATTALRSAIETNLLSTTKAVRGALHLPIAANFTLSGRKSELRLQVRNDSSSALRAVVRFESAKLKFPKSRQTLEVPADGSAEVVVPVEARSNGRFPVSVTLLTPKNDIALGEPMTITAKVSALAGLGQVVTATALLILLTWWAHNWRSKRRRMIDEAVAHSGHPSRRDA